MKNEVENTVEAAKENNKEESYSAPARNDRQSVHGHISHDQIKSQGRPAKRQVML